MATASQPGETAPDAFVVVVNDQDQHALWRAGLNVPSGWRRAAGRLVQVTAEDAGAITGRVISADSDGVTLDVGGTHRQFGYAALGAGAIQVEFGHPQTELGATGDGH